MNRKVVGGKIKGRRLVVLRELIEESKDGEWGKGEPFQDSVEMIAIRATDFDEVKAGRPENVPPFRFPPIPGGLGPNESLLGFTLHAPWRPPGLSGIITYHGAASRGLRWFRAAPNSRRPESHQWPSCERHRCHGFTNYPAPYPEMV